MNAALEREAGLLADALFRLRRRVVFAESCTAGLVAAALARTPGISDWHCGSAVTYREQTKIDWLDVSANDLAKHTAVSEPVARQLALGVLERTAEAEWSAAITGHLGPKAPDGFDGVVFIAIARRQRKKVRCIEVAQHQLTSRTRKSRQQEAAARVLAQLRYAIEAAEGQAKA